MTTTPRDVAAGPDLSRLLDDAGATDALFASDPVLSQVALAAPAVMPSGGGRRRLLDTIGKTRRFGRFADAVASLLGVGRELAQTLLDGIDRATSWAESPWPGVALYHLEGPIGGHRIASEAVIGFVRVAAGAPFPMHAHLGEESVLVVQGRLVATDGTESGPGDVVIMPAGSEHAFSAADGPDLVYLAVVRDGVRFGEVVMTPGHPDA